MERCIMHNIPVFHSMEKDLDSFIIKDLNNKIDEKEIWFMEVFAQKDGRGNFKVYSAAKIIFEGTDARIDQQRMNPQIKNIEFIFDKTQLDNIGKQLKTSPEAG